MKNPYLTKQKNVVLILVCALLILFPVCMVSAQNSGATVEVESSTSTPRVGDTLTVNLIISDVQNLGGLDVTLQWNSSILHLLGVDLRLGVESHPEGVLYGNRLNYDFETIVAGDIYVAEEKMTGSYNLVAQTTGKDTPSFNGSGVIAIITFDVVASGHSELSLEAELANYNPGGTSDLIDHTSIGDSINAITQGGASPTPSLTPSPSPSSSPVQSSSPSPTPFSSEQPTQSPDSTPVTSIPEAVYIVAVVATVGIIVTLVLLIKRKK